MVETEDQDVSMYLENDKARFEPGFDLSVVVQMLHPDLWDLTSRLWLPELVFDAVLILQDI